MSACTDNEIRALVEDVTLDESDTGMDTESPVESVPAADTNIPEFDTSPPIDTSPPEPEPLRESCLEILLDGLSVGDGEYEIEPPCGTPMVVTCDMTTDGGGWTQITHLDFGTDECPGDWQEESDFPFCSRQANDDSQRIRSAAFEGWCIPYSGVLGHVVAYQNGSTDAFGDTPANNIDDTYGDVISVTVPTSAGTEHLFSYVFGFKSGGSDDSNCPGEHGGASAPDFVGSDFLCETANLSTTDGPERSWYSDVPLFEDDWFQVAVSEEISTDVDVRLMATHTSDDEDVGIGEIILYIR